MNVERRRFGAILVGGALLLWKWPAAAGQDTASSSLEAQMRQQKIPDNQPPERSPEMVRAQLEEDQKKMKMDVEKLAQLAEDLKKEVESTDSASILSLKLVRKAEEVEKLARSIKTRARGW
jgi:predicted nuclease with TOPRIM domain